MAYKRESLRIMECKDYGIDNRCIADTAKQKRVRATVNLFPTQRRKEKDKNLRPFWG